MITLATLHQATPQEVFDQSANHLLAQNERSAIKNNKCRYRIGPQLKCAAGCFIADSEYLKKMEGDGWKMMVIHGQVPIAHGYLISDLQNIHDNYPVDTWPERLKNLADSLGLEFNTKVAAQA